jgi:hypothetical protein
LPGDIDKLVLPPLALKIGLDLCLSTMVQGFAAQSGGAVQIVSLLGEGTNVTLWLPHAEGGATETAHGEQGGSVSGPAEARILVCDDQAAPPIVMGASEWYGSSMTRRRRGRPPNI